MCCSQTQVTKGSFFSEFGFCWWIPPGVKALGSNGQLSALQYIVTKNILYRFLCHLGDVIYNS